MTNHFEIPLRFIDLLDEDPALALDPPAIGHFVEPTGKCEGKLAGRLQLRPDLDLGRYSVNAKIDWIRVGFTTGRHTELEGGGRRDRVPHRRSSPRHGAGRLDALQRHSLSGDDPGSGVRLARSCARRAQVPHGHRIYYVGARKGDLMFRVMDKTSAQKNPEKETRVELEQHERSARIEARLDQCVPEILGLGTVDDLIGFRIQKLRKLLFDFWWPTVSSGKGRGAGKPDAKELEAFKRTGVFGLERYQRATFDRHDEMRELGLIRGGLPEMGEKGYRRAYGGTESGGGMNKRVEQALSHLSGRWSKKALEKTLPPVE